MLQILCGRARLQCWKTSNGNSPRLTPKSRVHRSQLPFADTHKAKKGKGRQILIHAVEKATAVPELYKRQKLCSFSSVQMALSVTGMAVACSLYPLDRIAGWLIIGNCLWISISGYARCLFLGYKDLSTGGSLDKALLSGNNIAKKRYSFCPGPEPKGWNMENIMLSPFYEPSLVYLLCNCWGVFAIGQSTICQAVNGAAVLALFVSAFVVGRAFQFWINYCSKGNTVQDFGESGASVKEKLCEMFFLPSGTWGLGPLLNSLIWFSLFSFPGKKYLATPTGVTAPVWTAIGIPILLLAEDIYSMVNSERRRQKIGNGSTPGLQVASMLVGLICSFLIRGYV